MEHDSLAGSRPVSKPSAGRLRRSRPASQREDISAKLMLTNFDRRPVSSSSSSPWSPANWASKPSSALTSTTLALASDGSEQVWTAASLKRSLSSSSKLDQALKPVSSGKLDWERHRPGEVAKWDKHQSTLSYSPQGLWARSNPPQSWGSATGARHRANMPDVWCGEDDFDRHRPQARKKKLASLLLGMSGSQSKAQEAVPLQTINWQEIQNNKDLFDIREGLRLAVFKVTPQPLGSTKVWPPAKGDRVPASKEDTLVVYEFYLELLAFFSPTAGKPTKRDKALEEANNVGFELKGDPRTRWPAFFYRSEQTGTGITIEALNDQLDRAMDRRVRTTLSDDDQVKAWPVDAPADDTGPKERPGRCWELPHVSWPTIFRSFEIRQDLAVDIRTKTSYTALIKAFRAWRESRATDAQRQLGISLSMLFKFIWPFADTAAIAQMLSWICNSELEKLRYTTPPVISEPAREQIEAMFKSLDPRGSGSLDAYEFCGGEAGEKDAENRVIDPQTLKKILGQDKQFRLQDFYEIYAQDNFRGHEDAASAVIECGDESGAVGKTKLIIIKHRRPVLGWAGWVAKNTNQAERETWANVDALEHAVVRWRGMGAARAAAAVAAEPERKEKREYKGQFPWPYGLG